MTKTAWPTGLTIKKGSAVGTTVADVQRVKESLPASRFLTKREAEIICGEVDLAPGTVVYYE